ncbi:hypothetical protein [Bacteriovorax sp. Seq25_V]|uniref:hypothetical protein n=1 Tax=Bacteriovorax sp. Seq25_V TaxID=1201288 RepID=UPI00038A1969|nr:hypothetical protein [Bacteriovorax sp. Seq25_V]EQC45544.1 hypothetical protein M900_2241 [Bacteriovorax sp. Seq25_V]
MKKIFMFFLMLSTSAESMNCFPESNMMIGEKKLNQKSFLAKNFESGLSEIEFHLTLDKFEKVWAPIIQEKYNKKLIVERDWKNARVNAHATRDDQDNPMIVVRGGLARHPDITPDGLLLMLCHELGHHYGGAPKIFRGNTDRRSWSSAEGQADYFATSKCMPKIIEQDDSQVPESVQKSVEQVCFSVNCNRMVMAAMSVGRVFASLRTDWNVPEIGKTSEEKISKTIYSHPNPQCRFNTFIAGVNCDKEIYQDFDNDDYSIGACVNDERASRPACWFVENNY